MSGVLLTISWSLILSTVFASELCPIGSDITPIKRLRNDLFCNYDRYVRPRSDPDEYINVTVNLYPKHIDVHDSDNQVSVHMWVLFSWIDENLKWDPSANSDLKTIMVPTDTIWVPDITVYNTDHTNVALYQQTTCLLESTGKVECSPEIKTPLYCRMQLQDWPHDTQNCSMYMGSWSFGHRINAIPSTVHFNHEFYVQNQNWHLENVTVQSYDKQDNSLEYAFVLKRHAAMHMASLVVPGFVVSALTLSSFLVRRGRGHVTRVVLCCVSAVADVLLLQYVGFVVPANGDTCPTIVLFYRDALVMTFAALVLGVLVNAAGESGDDAPQWVVSSVARVRAWRGSGLLLGGVTEEALLQHDGEGMLPPRVQNSMKVPPYRAFADMFDRLAFLALLVTHAIMLAALLP